MSTGERCRSDFRKKLLTVRMNDDIIEKKEDFFMKTIKISAIIMSLIMVCCLCLSCLEGSAGGSSTESFRCGDPITSASEREDSGPSESTDPITSASEKEDSDSSGGEKEECVHELQRAVVAETCTTVGGNR